MDQGRPSVGMRNRKKRSAPMLYISKPDSSLGRIEPVFATMVYKM